MYLGVKVGRKRENCSNWWALASVEGEDCTIEVAKAVKAGWWRNAAWWVLTSPVPLPMPSKDWALRELWTW